MYKEDIITDTLSLLLQIKERLDHNISVNCYWSAVSHNPDAASVRYVDAAGFYIVARITNFNLPKLPIISLDDVIELDLYVKNNHDTLSRFEKLKAFT